MNVGNTAASAIVLGMCASGAFAISGIEFDDFESASTMNWMQGPPSPNQPFLVTEGMNTFIRNESSGGEGPGSRMAFFNRAQWTGNYTASGVTAISMDLRNSGDTTLYIRLGFRGTFGSQAATNDMIELAAGSGWQTMTFDISDMQVFVGGETPAEILAGVAELRIHSSQAVSFIGEPIIGTVDVDNIAAVVPAPGAAGLFGVGALAAGRRRRR